MITVTAILNAIEAHADRAIVQELRIIKKEVLQLRPSLNPDDQEHAEALLLDNSCRDNQHWGLVMTPDSHPTPSQEELVAANVFLPNPRGSLVVTEQPLADIGR